ncbi:MAG TPA: anhydro-N-acetylmuramic acid kinase [Burkholderiales bacterium]|nr:anhydro-N-acetylmuramic acid kinase [Burkholderiales bacterium]
MASSELYVGLMSGTSLDGIDAVLVDFSGDRHRIIGDSFVPYDEALRVQLLGMHETRFDELHDAAILGNKLAQLYASATRVLLRKCGLRADEIQAVGCHGQTIRHRPESGYTTQLGNGAVLAELTGITVVNDFRSRDIAAGGQGAPLVPAFHRAAFAHPSRHRVIVNLGGIGNLTDLPPSGRVRGFDTGPANMLMDAWIRKNNGAAYDKDGAWAASGTVADGLLASLLSHEYFSRKPPKSTGRDLFNLAWLELYLTGAEDAADVQATLLALTAGSIAGDIRSYCAGAKEVYVCGGGAANAALLSSLKAALPHVAVSTTADLGIDPDWVEACAFAWLARQALHLHPGNLPAVTGAIGSRVLGAIHPR